MTIDFAEISDGANTLLLREDDGVELSVKVSMDGVRGVIGGGYIVKITMTDTKTGNDATRTTTNGMVVAGERCRIPVSSVYEHFASMTEEIVVLNRMSGDTYANVSG